MEAAALGVTQAWVTGSQSAGQGRNAPGGLRATRGGQVDRPVDTPTKGCTLPAALPDHQPPVFGGDMGTLNHGDFFPRGPPTPAWLSGRRLLPSAGRAGPWRSRLGAGRGRGCGHIGRVSAPVSITGAGCHGDEGWGRGCCKGLLESRQYSGAKFLPLCVPGTAHVTAQARGGAGLWEGAEPLLPRAAPTAGEGTPGAGSLGRGQQAAPSCSPGHAPERSHRPCPLQGTSGTPGQSPGQVPGALCPDTEGSMDPARSGRHGEDTAQARHPALSRRPSGSAAAPPPGLARAAALPGAGPQHQARTPRQRAAPSPGEVRHQHALGIAVILEGGDSQAWGRHPGSWQTSGLGDLGEPPRGGSQGLPWSISTPRRVCDRRWRPALRVSFCVNKQELLVPNQGICVN